jgi:hypothetical protein
MGSPVVSFYSQNTVNPRYNGIIGPVIADARYSRVKGYSQKYIVEYIANALNKRRSTQCDHVNVFMLELLFI